MRRGCAVCMGRRAFLALAGAGACALAGCSGVAGDDAGSAEATSDLTATAFYFDTVLSVRATCTESVMQDVLDRCEYFENTLSRTIESSDVGRINAAAGAPVEVADETAELIGLALAYCEESDGRFDITIGAVSELWDFEAGVVPDADELAEAVRHVDYTQVTLDGTTVTLADPAARLDLGGIAKGYIADDLCARLAAAGVTSACVNLGGNVKVLGKKPDGTPWRLGVEDPNAADDDEREAIATMTSTGGSLVTSGLYERQFTQDGVTYWHILDPTTGYPVQTDLVSATITSDASIDGDAYATCAFMLGRDEALAFVEAHDDVECMVVDADGTMAMTSGCPLELA